MSRLKQSILGGNGPGERALHMSKQFAFQQRRRQRRAIAGQKGIVAAAAELMDGPHDHFLAGAAFAGDQHGCVGGAMRSIRANTSRIAGHRPIMPSKVLRPWQLGGRRADRCRWAAETIPAGAAPRATARPNRARGGNRPLPPAWPRRPLRPYQVRLTMTTGEVLPAVLSWRRTWTGSNSWLVRMTKVASTAAGPGASACRRSPVCRSAHVAQSRTEHALIALGSGCVVRQDEDLPRHHFVSVALGPSLAAASGRCRQGDGERRTHPEFALHFQCTAVLLQNAITDAQTQPGSLSHRFGGVERFEDLVQIAPV